MFKYIFFILLAFSACKIARNSKVASTSETNDIKNDLITAIATTPLPNLQQNEAAQASFRESAISWINRTQGVNQKDIQQWRNRLKNNITTYDALKLCKNNLPKRGIMDFTVVPKGVSGPTYDFDNPPHGYAKRELKSTTQMILNQLSIGANLNADLHTSLKKIDLDEYLKELHKKILDKTRTDLISLQKIQANSKELDLLIAGINRHVNILNAYLLWASTESSQVNLEQFGGSYFDDPYQVDKEHAVAIANNVLHNKSYSLDIFSEGLGLETSAGSSYHDYYNLFQSDSRLSTLLSLPEVSKEIGQPYVFNEQSIWDSSRKKFLSSNVFRQFNRILDEEVQISSQCHPGAPLCFYSIRDKASFDIYGIHKKITKSLVSSAIKNRLAHLNKKYSTLVRMHSPQFSYIEQHRLGSFDPHTDETDWLTSLPVSDYTPNVRFQRLYTLLKTLIYLDPLQAGQQLAKYSSSNIEIANIPLENIYCRSVSIIDFEINASETTNKAIDILSSSFLLLPPAAIIRSALLIKNATLVNRVIQATITGLNNPLVKYSSLPYLISTSNHIYYKTSSRTYINGLFGQASGTVGYSNNQHIQNEIYKLNQELEIAYSRLALSLFLEGVSQAGPLLKKQFKQVYMSQKDKRIQSFRNFKSGMQDMTAKLKGACR